MEFETKACLTPESVSCPLSWAVIFGISIGFSVETVDSSGKGSTSHGYFHGPQKSYDLTNTKSRAISENWCVKANLIIITISLNTNAGCISLHSTVLRPCGELNTQFLSSRLFMASARD